jgi:hypothetical protein
MKKGDLAGQEKLLGNHQTVAFRPTGAAREKQVYSCSLVSIRGFPCIQAAKRSGKNE